MGGNYYIRNKNGVPLFSRKVTTINNVAGENSNSTSEVVLSSILIPANTIVDNNGIYGSIGNVFNIDTFIQKNGTNGSFTGRIRIGPNQSTSDTLVATTSTTGTTSSLLNMSISRDLKVIVNSSQLAIDSNQTNITIPTSGPASVYPITFTVPFNQKCISVGLQLSGYSHTFPGDVGMVLVSPDNRYTLITGRAGGTNDAINRTVNIISTESIPWDGYSAGNFKNNTSIVFPMTFNSPCPVPPLTSGNSPEMITFYLSDSIQGTWSLYIQDFSGGDSGTLSGATLVFTTSLVFGFEETEVISRTQNITIDDTYSGRTLSNLLIDWTSNNYISITGQLTSSLDQMNCKYIYVKKYK